MYFFDYVKYKTYKGEPIDDAWTNITTDDFDTFRMSTEYLKAREGHGSFAAFISPTESSTVKSSTNNPPGYSDTLKGNRVVQAEVLKKKQPVRKELYCKKPEESMT